MQLFQSSTLSTVLPTKRLDASSCWLEFWNSWSAFVALESQNRPLLATLGAANAGAAANPVAPRTAARARNESFFMIELHVHIGEEHGECRAGSSAAPVTSR